MSTASDLSNTKNHFDAAKTIVEELTGMSAEDQTLALKFAMETLKLQIPAGQAQMPLAPAPLPQVATYARPVATGQGADIKSFTEAKAPKSDQQFAAVVAYYFQFQAPEGQRKESIDATTMKEAARLVGRKQVGKWLVTLNNSRRSGYLDNAGRGAFKLNAVGENLVAMTLPDNAASSNGSGVRKKRTKKKELRAKKA